MSLLLQKNHCENYLEKANKSIFCIDLVFIYKVFIVSILFSSFLGYAFGSGVVAYGPVIVLVFIVIATELAFRSRGVKREDLVAIFVWLPYVFIAALYYAAKPLDGKLLSTHLFVLINIPLLILAFSRIYQYENVKADIFFAKVMLLYMLAELIVCLGQISTYAYGVGFPTSELYSHIYMVTGTFINQTDLGAVVLVLVFSFTLIECKFSAYFKFIYYLISVLLLLIAGSRSALVLTALVFVLSWGVSLRRLFYYFLIIVFGFIFFAFLYRFSEIEVVQGFFLRILSIFNIFQYGLSSDNSMSLRLGSYIHFLFNIPILGLGSGEVNNYHQYADGAKSNITDLMFLNPHSLIVEVGYWLGWPGFFAFVMANLYMLIQAKKRLLLVLVLVLSSSIPSSVLGSMTYFLFALFAYYLSQRNISAHPLPSPAPTRP